MTPLDVIRQHIELVEGALGPKPRIVGTRIRVADIVGWHIHQGMSPAELVEQLAGITLADVYAALAYYWDHRDELEALWAEEERWVEEYKKQHPDVLEVKSRRLASS